MQGGLRCFTSSARVSATPLQTPTHYIAAIVLPMQDLILTPNPPLCACNMHNSQPCNWLPALPELSITFTTELTHRDTIACHYFFAALSSFPANAKFHPHACNMLNLQTHNSLQLQPTPHQFASYTTPPQHHCRLPPTHECRNHP